jgi:hypothetical protein
MPIPKGFPARSATLPHPPAGELKTILAAGSRRRKERRSAHGCQFRKVQSAEDHLQARDSHCSSSLMYDEPSAFQVRIREYSG